MDLERYEGYIGLDGNLNFRRTPGVEKDPRSRELSKLDEIEEIPYYDFVARLKVEHEYHKHLASYRRIKADLYAQQKKLNNIQNKLDRYKHYPDIAGNRHKLLDQKRECERHIGFWEAALWRTTRVKLQNCAKALGKRVMADSEFII